MNAGHFAAIVRMRWQLMRNRFRKHGKLNWIITLVVIALASLGSLAAFLFAAGWGSVALAKLGPVSVIFVWDALAAVFLVGWVAGVMTELQQPQVMSLKNLLHLPISLRGAFFLNYASSLVSLSVLLLVPAMLGLCVASTIHYGPASLVCFALLAAFVFMVTALSYQFRGWLARLMENKRTRGTVVAAMTIGFVLLGQVPNLVNVLDLGSRGGSSNAITVSHADRINELQGRLESGDIDAEQYDKLIESANADLLAKRDESSRADLAALHQKANVINAVLPVGWLPYGASAAAGGAIVVPWLCFLGMSGLGLGSFTMAYHGAVRSQTGHSSKPRRRVTATPRPIVGRPSMLERRVPGLSDIQSTIMMATLRSTLRAPEAKMALLTPLIFAFIFATMIYRGPMARLPALAQPWFGVAAIGMSLVGMTQMMLNIFGSDRQGFRAYVLMPARRQDILLGKNFGILPIAGSVGFVLILVVGILGKMQFTHIAATLVQWIIALILYWPIANHVSIFFPIGMATGSMKPVSVKLSVIVMQFVAIFMMPLALMPAAVTLAIDLAARFFGGIGDVPLYLLLTLVELPIAFWVYRRFLDVQGGQLEQREQAILEIVTKVAD